MGFSINTNVDALNTYTNLTKVQNSLSSSLAKLSSGLRINNAGDDAAGLTIATDIGAQVSGLQQASRNAQDGTSVVQTADGALSQVQSLLGNLRDLAVQAANDSNSDSARAAITTQANAITAEISRLGSSVNFNGRNLLDGSLTSMNFQVGADGNSASQINVNLSGANLISIANNLTNGSTGASQTLAQAAATTTVVGTNSNGNVNTLTLSSSLTTALGSATTVDQAVAAYNQDSAFSANFVATKVAGATAAADKVVITAKDGSTVTSTDGTNNTFTAAAGAGQIKFDSAANAQASIASIQTQLDNVSKARAQIGAAENRFTSAESTISTAITNLTAAKSRITDVDMASEMVNYSRANILSQSGTAMLAQANSLPQLALKLLS
jgi:flagellin